MAQARYIVADGVEVTSAEDRDFYAGIFGSDLRVLDIGSKFDYEITSNTTITVADGVLVCEGGRLQITNGSIDTFTIPTGTANVTSYYIIGYRVYADGTATEQFVRKMSNATATIARASIRGGSNDSYLSLYRVVQNGINIESVTPLFTYVGSWSTSFPVSTQNIADGAVTISKLAREAQMNVEELAVNETTNNSTSINISAYRVVVLGVLSDGWSLLNTTIIPVALFRNSNTAYGREIECSYMNSGGQNSYLAKCSLSANFNSCTIRAISTQYGAKAVLFGVR